MARSRNSIQSPKPWEALASFFGYFAVAKDAPYILRTLCLSKLVPSRTIRYMLHFESNPDFWLLCSFTLGTLFFYFVCLTRYRTPIVEQDTDKDAALYNRAFSVYDRERRLRYIRTLGFLYLREKTLDKLGVSLYGTFRRPSYWPLAPGWCDYIDRITFMDKTGIEVQYSLNYSELFIRRHRSDTDNFGESQIFAPGKKEFAILLIASNYFLFWWLISLFMKIVRRSGVHA